MDISRCQEAGELCVSVKTNAHPAALSGSKTTSRGLDTARGWAAGERDAVARPLAAHGPCAIKVFPAAPPSAYLTRHLA